MKLGTYRTWSTLRGNMFHRTQWRHRSLDLLRSDIRWNSCGCIYPQHPNGIIPLAVRIKRQSTTGSFRPFSIVQRCNRSIRAVPNPLVAVRWGRTPLRWELRSTWSSSPLHTVTAVFPGRKRSSLPHDLFPDRIFYENSQNHCENR